MLTLVLSCLAAPLAAPAAALLLLTFAATGRRAAAACPVSPRPRVAVLVPAHNESTHLLPTLASVRGQLGPSDRLLVVADNCDDDTAAVARSAGAAVVERHDPMRRGKGYALAFGMDQMRADPPEVVFIVDADCILREGSVAAVAAQCAAEDRPVQMLNLMHAAPGAGLRERLLAFAMVMKNKVRPLGSFRLGGSCHLMGTGMALPWTLAAQARLATGHIAEDMKLGLALALHGRAAAFSLAGEVASGFPRDAQAARAQKARWEHGHLATIVEELPRLLRAASAERRPALAVLALDLLIPPLALYALVLSGAFALALAATMILPAAAPAAGLLGGALGMLALAVGLGWWGHGQHLLRARELLAAPVYALWKLPVYAAFACGRRSGWVRARRASE